MQGTHAVIRLSPNLFPRSTWRTLNIERPERLLVQGGRGGVPVNGSGCGG